MQQDVTALAKTKRDGLERISSAVLSTTQPPLRKTSRALVEGGACVACGRPGRQAAARPAMRAGGRVGLERAALRREALGRGCSYGTRSILTPRLM